jgi:PAS domain S-box-containing protein
MLNIEESRQRVAVLTSLLETQREVITLGCRLDPVLQLLATRAAALVNADAAVIELAEGADLVHRAATGTLVRSTGLRLPRETSLSGSSLRSGQVVRCADSELDPRVNRDLCRALRARSFVILPLVHSGSPVGALRVVWGRPHAFGEPEVERLALLAGFASTAIATAAENQARASAEEDLRLTFEMAPMGMAVVALDGRISKVNRSLCELLGHSREQLLASTVQDITHPDDLEVDLAFATRLVQGDISRYRLQKRYVRADGSVFTGLLHVSLVRQPTGAPEHLVAQLEQLHARETLLPADVAHEINNPLASVTANLALLAEARRAVTGPPAALLEIDALLADAAAGAERVREAIRRLRPRDPVSVATPATDAAAAPARTRVLVVDDDADVGKATARILRREHEVVSATSVREAIALLEAGEHFDAIVSDVTMPDLTGADLYRILEQRWPELTRRIAFVTGGSFAPDALALLVRAGAPWLEKPFEVAALRALVRGLLTR